MGFKAPTEEDKEDGEDMGVEVIAIVGVGMVLLAVLVPLNLAQARRFEAVATDLGHRIEAVASDVATTRTEISADLAEVRRELREDLSEVRREVRNDLAELRREVRTDAAEVRTDLHVLSDRVARIEGALTGPWRPANGPPSPPPSAPPEATG